MTPHQPPPLAALAAGTLPPDESERAAVHVAACRACAAELADWRALRGALAGSATASPRPVSLEAVRLRVAAGRRPAAAVRFGTLLRAEAPVVRRRIWAASVLVLLLGFPVTLFGVRGGSLLALVAPAVAAASVGFVYGPAADPPLELALSTPTSPRLVLLARLTLVFGFDLLVGLVASALVAAAGQAPGGLEALVLRWLGPMLMLSALSLCVSLRAGPTTGIGVALGLWAGLLALGPGLDGAVGAAATLLQQTNVVTVGAAVLLGGALLALLPRGARLPA